MLLSTNKKSTHNVPVNTEYHTLLTTNKKSSDNESINDELVSKKMEDQIPPTKESNVHLHMVWLKDENGHLFAHWTNQS